MNGGLASGSKTMRSSFLKAGHLPTLVASFLYFDLSFMVWVILGPLGVLIAADLHLSPGDKGLMVATPVLAGALLRMVNGVLVDRFKAKRIGMLMQCLVIAGLVGSWFIGISNFLEILALGIVLGIAGASFAIALPLASYWYPPEHQGTALGIAGAGNSGTVLASLFVPAIAVALGWRNALGLAALPLLAVFVLFVVLAKDSPRSPPPKSPMPGKLDGLSIIIPESREADLFAGLLEAEGAAAIRCPLVQIADLDDFSALDTWINRLIAGEFEDVILLTGEGLRRIMARCDQLGQKPAAIDGLKRVRTIIRGPKPGRALRELGLSPGISAAAPTSEGVVDALAGEHLHGRKIGVQLYPGESAGRIVNALRAKGALVSDVTPYRYASEAETSEVAKLIRKMAAGEVGMIAFTSSPQIERLAEVARVQNLDKELAQGLSRARVAAIGPIVEQALQKHGFSASIIPNSPHLKPFVRAISSAWSSNH